MTSSQQEALIKVLFHLKPPELILIVFTEEFCPLT